MVLTVCRASEVALDFDGGEAVFDRNKAAEFRFQEVIYRKRTERGSTSTTQNRKSWRIEEDPRRKEGFIVFVDFISKKVSRSWLRDIFEQYGTVLDVYIAYFSPKRASYSTTFGFIRFKTKGGMEKVIRDANGIKVNGFHLKVYEYREGDHLRGNWNSGSAVCDKKDHSDREVPPKKSFLEVVRSSPSLGEVMGIGGTDKGKSTDAIRGDGVNRTTTKTTHTVAPNEVSYEFLVPASDMKWVDACIARILKENANMKEVQRELMVMGFKCQIVPWGGLSVIGICDSVMERDKMLTEKKEMLDTWFDTVEAYKSGVTRPTFLIWVSLANVPIELWHESFFRELGERWGRLLEIHEDTTFRRRLDVAKLLLWVEDVHDIPLRIRVKYRGVNYVIQIDTDSVDSEDYEDMVSDSLRQRCDQNSEGESQRDDGAVPKVEGSLQLDEKRNTVGDTPIEEFYVGTTIREHSNDRLCEPADNHAHHDSILDQINPCGLGPISSPEDIALNEDGERAQIEGVGSMPSGGQRALDDSLILISGLYKQEDGVESDRYGLGCYAEDPLTLGAHINHSSTNWISVPVDSDNSCIGPLAKRDQIVGDITVDVCRSGRRGRKNKLGKKGKNSKVHTIPDMLFRPANRLLKRKGKCSKKVSPPRPTNSGVIITEIPSNRLEEVPHQAGVRGGMTGSKQNHLLEASITTDIGNSLGIKFVNSRDSIIKKFETLLDEEHGGL